MAKMNISGYVVPSEFTKVQRAAHFLDWAAKYYPGEYISFALVTQAINALPRLPRHDNSEIPIIRKRMSRVGKILRTVYGRDIDTQRGVGVRATVDGADTLKQSLPGCATRVRSATARLKETASLIDPKMLPSTPEMQPYRSWLKDVDGILKQIGTASFDKKLLPPAKLEE